MAYVLIVARNLLNMRSHFKAQVVAQRSARWGEAPPDAMSKKAGGHESWFVAAEDDDRATRPKWIAQCCPKACDCSPKSFHDANCMSYISEDRCREYVYLHLKGSGKHQYDDSYSRELAEDAEIRKEMETFADREANRSWLTDHQNKQRAAPEENHERRRTTRSRSRRAPGHHRTRVPSPPSPPPARKMPSGAAASDDQTDRTARKLDNLERKLEAMADTLAASAGGVQPLSLASGSGLHPPPPPLIVELSPIQVQRSSAEALDDSISRILSAMTNASMLLISTVQTLSAEGQRIKAAQDAIKRALDKDT